MYLTKKQNLLLQTKYMIIVAGGTAAAASPVLCCEGRAVYDLASRLFDRKNSEFVDILKKMLYSSSHNISVI